MKFRLFMRETHVLEVEYEVEADSEEEARELGRHLAPGEEVGSSDASVIDWELRRVERATQ